MVHFHSINIKNLIFICGVFCVLTTLPLSLSLEYTTPKVRHNTYDYSLPRSRYDTFEYAAPNPRHDVHEYVMPKLTYSYESSESTRNVHKDAMHKSMSSSGSFPNERKQDPSEILISREVDLYLNKYGIPRILAKTNPYWKTYCKKLLEYPEKRRDIERRMRADLIEAQTLCVRLGRCGTNYENIKIAHQLLVFKNDPAFKQIAYKALRDIEQLPDYLVELARRDSVSGYMNSIARADPSVRYVLDSFRNKLLQFAFDPQVKMMIDLIAKHPSRAQTFVRKLTDRNKLFVDLMKKLKSKKFTAVMEDMMYAIVDAKSDVEQLDVLCGLYSDFVGDSDLNPYAAFYDQEIHLPKIFEYDQDLVQAVKSISLPAELSVREFIFERAVYTQVMRQPISSELQREQALQYITILKSACMPGVHQDMLRALVQLAGQVYLQAEMQPTVAIREQNIVLLHKINEYIKRDDYELAANHMQILHSELVQFGAGGSQATMRMQNFLQQDVTIKVGQAAHREHEAEIKRSVSHIPRNQDLLKGGFFVQTKQYVLSADAESLFDSIGAGAEQFIWYTGSMVQHDAHAKLVNVMNALANVHPLTDQGRLIKEGALTCLMAAYRYNQDEQTAQASIFTDFCSFIAEKTIDFIDKISALGLVPDAYISALYSMAVQNFAHSLKIFQARIDAYRGGFATGTEQDIVDIEGISNTLNALQSLVHILDRAGAVDMHQTVLNKNRKRYCDIVTILNYLTKQTSNIRVHMADISADERDFVCVGQETVEPGIKHAGLVGLCKIGQGVAKSAARFSAYSPDYAESTCIRVMYSKFGSRIISKE